MKQDARFCYPDPVTSSVVFDVENRKLYASKEVLALCSPVFRRMFESDFRERTAEWITLPGKTYKEFTDFLLCLYPDTQKSLTDDTVFSVFHLADEYQVEILQRKCEDYLMSKCKDTNTALSALVNILLCAESYNLKDLFNVSFDRVSKINPEQAKAIQEFSKLSEDTKLNFNRLRQQALDIKLTDGNVHEVLRVAADYNESDLVSQCENHMIARCKKNEKPLIHGLVSMLSAADKHKLTKLKEEVLQLAVKRKSHELEASPIFKTLSAETRCKVLIKRLKIFEGLFAKLCKLRCHCCRKHADYNCKICFILTTKECFENAGLTF
ncbi:kelch repeat and BTB domain-containing protein 3-like [Mya arenaria]|uniref:kelch repeat and BTB domain-containing protein 3-like n=1 Tax=Mya arenaria TaxID=6604 RepID=UPI0022E002E4|nr:kelch repeat and BTB domain-containing protein 3-like [Mya arenaria]